MEEAALVTWEGESDFLSLLSNLSIHMDHNWVRIWNLFPFYLLIYTFYTEAQILLHTFWTSHAFNQKLNNLLCRMQFLSEVVL